MLFLCAVIFLNFKEKLAGLMLLTSKFPNYYENVIVIVADLLILYARIVNLTFKNYLWKPF
jgi:hypothetical protein